MPESLVVVASLLAEGKPGAERVRAGLATAESQTAVAQQLADHHSRNAVVAAEIGETLPLLTEGGSAADDSRGGIGGCLELATRR
jgi:hypothetical protein